MTREGYPVEEEITDEWVEVPWQELRGKLKFGNDPVRMEHLLDLFEKKYNVASAAEALTQIPNFLGHYMVCEFDYRDFCSCVGSIDEQSAKDDELWTAHLSKHLTEDLVAAASLMLRVAVTVAKAHQLETSDWQDINHACSRAVRALPACYRLQRALPGALSLARAWQFLPDGPEEAVEKSSGNPWNSEESKTRFEEMYHLPWAQIEAVANDDKEVLGCCSGCFQAVDVTEVEGITLVSLKALHVGTAPAGFPEKPLEKDDVIMWEVEASLGRLLQPGFNIEADFYEVHNDACFMSALVSIAPAWLP